MVVLFVDASRKQHEKVHTISLCFLKKDLEEQYRDYQYELARQSLSGRWGALAITSMVVCINNALAYIQQIMASIKAGTVERLLAGAPLTLFIFYHQYLVQTGGTPWDSKASCEVFIVRLALLFVFTENLIAYVNELYPDSEGCPAFRFRCPHTFSGTMFAARGAVLAAITIFHLTPCMSF